MSFADIIQSNIDDARKKKQDELTALQQGYVQNAEGKWEATELQQQKETIQKSQYDLMQEELNSTKQAVAAQQSKFNADGITNILTSIARGQWKDAYQAWNTTPGLKDALKKSPSLNINEIAPINFSDPLDVEKLKQLNIDTRELSNPDFADALQRSLMKIQGHDGSWRILPIDSAMKQTNSFAYMNSQQVAEFSQQARAINSIIKSSSPAKGELETLSAEKQLQDMKAFFEKNPTATYADYAKSGASLGPKDQLDMLKTSAEIEKIAAQTKQAEANVKKAEAEAAAAKASTGNKTNELSAIKLEEAKREKAILSYTRDNYTSFVNDLDTKGAGDKVLLEDGTAVSAIELAATVQGDAKLETTERQLLTGFYDAHKAFTNLKTELSDPKLNWDALSKGMEELAKYDPDDYLKLTDAQKKSILNKFSFNSKLSVAMGAYIKAMSGAAVSDEERKFYTTAMTAGNWSNKDAALSSLEGFTSGLKQSFNNRLVPLKSTYPKDYLIMKNLIPNKADTPPASSTTVTAEELSGMTREQKIEMLKQRGL